MNVDEQNVWLECILKRKAYDETPIKVLAVEEGGAAPGKGENFFSTIRKVKAKALLGSGRIKTVSLLIKCEPVTEELKKLSRSGGVFQNEIAMYRDVLPKMERLLEEINDPDGIFWAKCYDVRLYDRLVFEDLTASGYKVANRKEQLSLNAALMAVKHFAKFHALSKILIDRGEIPMDVFGQYIFFKDAEGQKLLKRIVQENLRGMCAVVRNWGDDWKEALERLEKADISQAYVDSFRPGCEEFTVLCHGDTWTNNMMFRGDDLENPTSLRLMDFQLSFLNSPAKDLTHFFISSVRLEDRKQHIDLLIQTYTDALTAYLLKLGYKGSAPTADEIRRSCDSRAAMQLNDALGFIPVAMGDSEDAPDFEAELKKLKDAEDGREDGATGSVKKIAQRCEPIIKHEIKKAMESGLI